MRTRAQIQQSIDTLNQTFTNGFITEAAYKAQLEKYQNEEPAPEDGEIIPSKFNDEISWEGGIPHEKGPFI